jgi:hypothetical protein
VIEKVREQAARDVPQAALGFRMAAQTLGIIASAIGFFWLRTSPKVFIFISKNVTHLTNVVVLVQITRPQKNRSAELSASVEGPLEASRTPLPSSVESHDHERLKGRDPTGWGELILALDEDL